VAGANGISDRPRSHAPRTPYLTGTNLFPIRLACQEIQVLAGKGWYRAVRIHVFTRLHQVVLHDAQYPQLRSGRALPCLRCDA
jgi:hypothetical protein